MSRYGFGGFVFTSLTLRQCLLLVVMALAVAIVASVVKAATLDLESANGIAATSAVWYRHHHDESIRLFVLTTAGDVLELSRNGWRRRQSLDPPVDLELIVDWDVYYLITVEGGVYMNNKAYKSNGGWHQMDPMPHLSPKRGG